MTEQLSFDFGPSYAATNDPAFDTYLGRRASRERQEFARLRFDDPQYQELKRSVRLRARNCCESCGALAYGSYGEIDHRLPLADGGDNSKANLRLLCLACHDLKTATESVRRRKQSL